jgi:hypothetical protein
MRQIIHFIENIIIYFKGVVMIIIKNIILSGCLIVGFSSISNAKCFHFSNTGGQIGVCVSGDSFDSRKEAKKICDDKVGNCGNVTSSASRCHSNNNQCYDENGNAKRELTGY